MTLRRSDKSAIKLNKIRDRMTIHHSLALISGTIIGSDNEYVTLTREDGLTFTWPIVDSLFKCFAPLKEGSNMITISGETIHPVSVDFELIYRPQIENQRCLRVIYLICRDEWGEIFEKGSFQSTPGDDNSLRSAKEKISLAVLMMQTFFGETVPAHHTFQVELDDDGQPLVYTFTLEQTYKDLWAMDQQQLWDLVADCILSSKLSNVNCKYLGFCSFSRYLCEPGTGRLKSSLTALDIRKMTRGYVALGGGGLALLSTSCLYSWPNRIDQINECLTDSRLIDRTMLMDDSGNRGTYSGCYSTTLGACIHELGHIFDLGHNSMGMMSSHYPDIDKFFLVKPDGGSDTHKWWDRSSALILTSHKWFNNFPESKDAFKLSDSTLRSRYGVQVIEYRGSNGVVKRFREFFLASKWVKLEIMPDDAYVIAMDIRGNIFKKELHPNN
ncbi:putative zinc metalloproteinase YIL108W [Tetranychus urticae]|uniref:Uncharacterized protein n=1 Tax=Tetranychus urticae TaxID=32264 RepID=T1JRI7_TETUR|nr:putative zinc metalloproteinase YIL108W [Tetranychus urticae]